MGFDGEAFVQAMREDLWASGRTLDRAVWVERVAAGEATANDLVGWARQHYWGVTYHTRRFLSIWLARVPHDVRDGVTENTSEIVLGRWWRSGRSPSQWLSAFTRALGAPDEVITDATRNADAFAADSLLYNLAHQRPWYELHFGVILAIENQIPVAYDKAVKGFRQHYAGILGPDDFAFHTIHSVVDDRHEDAVGAFVERWLDTDDKRRAARAAFFAGAELTRRCWDACDEATW